MLKKIMLIAFIIFILGLPYIFRDQAPLIGAGEYRVTQHVTQPSYFGNLAKAGQIIFEQEPCQYQVLGWDDAETVYYEAACRDVAFFAYDVQQGRLSRVNELPTSLANQPLADWDVLPYVRADGVRPVRHEFYTRPLLLVDNSGVASPSGKNIAFVTKRIYGPQDLIVISQ